jgi:predicted membrane protein
MDIETTLFLAFRIMAIATFITTTIGTAILIYYRRRDKKDTSEVQSADMREILVLFYAAATAFVTITPFLLLGFLWLFFVTDCLKLELALLMGMLVQIPLMFHILKNDYPNPLKGSDTNE